VAVTGAGYLLEYFGVDALPAIAGALLLLVVGASLAIRVAPVAPSAHDRPPLFGVLRQPGVASFFLSVSLMCGAHMALYAFYSLYLERAGYSKSVIGMMWALGVVCEVVFFYFQSHVFARFGAQRVIMVAFAVAVLRFALIGAGADWLWVLIAAQVMHAVSFGAHHSASVQAMQRWFAGPLQASGQALYMSLGYGVGGTLGGLLMSLVWDKVSPEGMFYAAAALSFRSQRLTEAGRPQL
jgi:PPP family 3-phenylpropionic acid transporter